MKEVPPIKTLPPKKSGGSSNTSITPTKAPPDEILSALLRLNNHDSFSSIKDESLDIDLSACVTINAGDSAPNFNGNSFSSTDFWRMLDENAQATQLELACASDESMSKMSDAAQDTTTATLKAHNSFGTNFGDKFLRPNPPPAATTNARKTPVKLASSQSHFEPLDHKIFSGIPKDLTITRIDRPSIIKLEPVDQLPDIIIEEEKTQEQQQQSQPPQQLQTAAAGVAEAGTVVAAEPIHKCMTCNGLLLRTPQELTTHEVAAHRIMHGCSLCEREFEQEAGLKKHLKSHKTVEARKDSWRKCPDCGKCLKLGSMWMHRKIHSENKKYACDICGQKFVQKINLTHHARVHTAEKPYECPECQKRFQERSHLQRHQKYHAQTRSYRCEKCGKMYKTERCLKVHNLVHLEQRPFACNVCDKSFISNSKLKQHSNIHTGERPFKCNYCPRDFTNFPNWLKHTRRRHKVDHKTGEQLENIPSYCSKKSTKTTKQPVKTTTNNNEQLTAATTGTATKPKNANQTNKTAKNAPAVKTNNTTTTLTNIQQPVNLTNELTKLNTTQMPVASASNVVATKSATIKQMQQMQTNNKIEPPKLQPATTLAATVTTPTTANSTNATTTPVLNSTKTTKVKRERKQPMPRQVQKTLKISTPQQQHLATTALGITIKQENCTELLPPTSKVKNTQADFPDLHGLSLTSAEELIMEQALEMEECGLYDAPISSIGDTDNAISAEAAAALQFNIKKEFIDCKDEIALKDSNKRLLCSSLESSPYSSPASIELPAIHQQQQQKLQPVSPTNNIPMEFMTTPLTTYYMQPFQGAMLSRICSNNSSSSSNNNNNGMATFCDTRTTTSSSSTSNSNALTTSSITSPSAAAAAIQLLPQMLHQQHQQQSIQNGQQQLNEVSLPSTQAFLNHFFLPMTVNMQQNNKQVLPSVETLLFSANASLFASSSTTATSTNNAQPPPSLTIQQRNLS